MKKRIGIIGLTAILGLFGMSVMASEQETPSLSSEAHAMSAGDAYVTVTDRVPILFGASKEDVELKFGATGVLEREEPLEGTDLTTEYYAVQAKWFDWESRM